LLGLPQGDPGAYTLLADGIRQFGNDVPGDLHELWRRLVFSLRFLAGAKPVDNCASKHLRLQPTPVPSSIRSWMKPDA
jgi:hypothetical protein